MRAIHNPPPDRFLGAANRQGRLRPCEEIVRAGRKRSKERA